MNKAFCGADKKMGGSTCKLPGENRVASVNGSYTYFVLCVEKCLRTIEIKNFQSLPPQKISLEPELGQPGESEETWLKLA